jgi:hypothetical protein
MSTVGSPVLVTLSQARASVHTHATRITLHNRGFGRVRFARNKHRLRLIATPCSGMQDTLRRHSFMPFKSKAQRRKFAQLLVEGKIKPETYEEWNRETGSKDLPEKVRPKKKATASKAKGRPAAKRSRRKSSPTRP